MKEADLYNWKSFGFDSIGVGVFFWITHKINLFEQGSLEDFPAYLFAAMTSIPLLSIFSRQAMDLAVRWPLVAVGVLAAVVGWIVSATTSQSEIAWWMMWLLLADLGIYLIINFIEDGDPKKPVKFRYWHFLYWYPFKKSTASGSGEVKPSGSPATG